MSNLDYMLNLENISLSVELIKTSAIILFSYYLFVKFLNIKDLSFKNIIIALISVPIVSIIVTQEKYKNDSYQGILILIIICTLTNFINFKKDIVNSILVTILSISVNYAIFVVSITIAFVPNAIFKISNDYGALVIILSIYSFLLFNTVKIKKIKYGITFLQKKVEDVYFSIVFFNIVIIILFFIMIIQDRENLNGKSGIITFIVLSLIMLIDMKKSIQLYYKQNLLVKDLEATKKELEEKNS